MNPTILIVMCVCFAFGIPIFAVSVLSLRYREGKPFQAKVYSSNDDLITVKYKIRGKVYYKDLPWQPINPLAVKPKPGHNVTLKGTPENPTHMISSSGGLESSFAIKIVGIIIGSLFLLIGLFFLLMILLNTASGIFSRNNAPLPTSRMDGLIHMAAGVFDF